MRELLVALGKTGAGSVVSLVLGAVTMKVLALAAGPAGVGLFSLVRHTTLTGTVVATFNGQPALVQGIASRSGAEQATFTRGALALLAASAASVAAVLLLVAPWFGAWMFPMLGGDAVAAVRWLAPAVVAGACYSALTGVLNGHRAIGRLALVQVTNVGVLALLALPAARLVAAGHTAAFSWLLFAAAGVGSVVAWRIAAANAWLPPTVGRGVAVAEGARAFLRTGGVLLLTGALAYGAQLVVRATVARAFGLAGAGVFDVAWTFSMTYIVLLLTSFQTYYLPELSRAQPRDERAVLVRRVFRLATLALVPLVTTVVVLKPLVVRILYSADFLAATDLMSWMLLGDFLKVSAWTLAMPMLALGDMRPFVWTEVAWNGAWLVASLVVVTNAGWMTGIAAAFAACYALYFVAVLLIARRRYAVALSAAVVGRWFGGLAVVVGASIHTWAARGLDPIAIAIWPAIAVAFSALSLGPADRARVARAASAARRRLRGAEGA